MATQLKPNVDCSAEEWQARLDLAACYRIFDLMGWSESIYNHISLKVPGEEDTFLINPFGLLYDEVTASNLVKVDVEGNNVGPSQYMVNKAGFTQHAYFHKTLGERAHAICHVHTTATMAVCSHEDGLMPTNFYACNFQRACEIQVATVGMGKPNIVPQEVVDIHQRDISVMQSQGGAGIFDFEAWKRKVDKIDTSWRD